MEQPTTLALTAADPVRTRIDRVVLRYDAAAKKTSLQVLEGVPDSAGPAAPAITRTELVYDLCLAEIKRPAGSTAVTVADIYDNITTEREGYVKRTPFSAIEYITREMYTTLDPAVCVPVLTRIKDAFLGSRVVLSDGSKGKIAAFPNDFQAKPIIEIAKDNVVNLNDRPDLKITEYNPK